MLLIDEAIENRITRINEFLPVFLSVLLQALQNHNERRKKKYEADEKFDCHITINRTVTMQKKNKSN